MAQPPPPNIHPNSHANSNPLAHQYADQPANEHADIAASIQRVTEETLLKMANYAYQRTGLRELCMSGGVALNSVANGRILWESPFEDAWIQPATPVGRWAQRYTSTTYCWASRASLYKNTITGVTLILDEVQVLWTGSA